MHRLILLVILIVALGPVRAGTARSQGTGRSLDIQPGARENGMGAAGVALLADPSDAVWWNPAALGFARRPSGQLTYARLVPGVEPGVRYWHVAAASPVGGIAGVGFAYTCLNYGPSEVLGPGGDVIRAPNANEKSPWASAGIAVLPNLAFGVTAKWIRFKGFGPSSSSRASTFGFDGGALYRLAVDSLALSLGANVQNLGPEVSFPNEVESFTLTRNLKVGAAIQFHTILDAGGAEVGGAAVIDYNHTLLRRARNFETWNGGVEAYGGVHDLVRLSLRGGYYYDPVGDIQDLTFGAGLRIVGLTVDAGLIPQARTLKRVKKFTVGYHFHSFPNL